MKISDNVAFKFHFYSVKSAFSGNFGLWILDLGFVVSLSEA